MVTCYCIQNCDIISRNDAFFPPQFFTFSPQNHRYISPPHSFSLFPYKNPHLSNYCSDKTPNLS